MILHAQPANRSRHVGILRLTRLQRSSGNTGAGGGGGGGGARLAHSQELGEGRLRHVAHNAEDKFALLGDLRLLDGLACISAVVCGFE